MLIKINQRIKLIRRRRRRNSRYFARKELIFDDHFERLVNLHF